MRLTTENAHRVELGQISAQTVNIVTVNRAALITTFLGKPSRFMEVGDVHELCFVDAGYKLVIRLEETG
jgi:hypothetical protein